jgi:hypothetical protein
MNGIYNSLSQAGDSLKQSLAEKMPDINAADDSNIELFEETLETAFLHKRTAK